MATSRHAVDKKLPLRRQSEDHHFGSLLMLAVTAGAFLLVIWVATKALFFFLHESSIPLNASSQSASFLPGIHLPSRANNRLERVSQAAATLADQVVGSNTAITASPIPAL